MNHIEALKDFQQLVLREKFVKSCVPQIKRLAKHFGVTPNVMACEILDLSEEYLQKTFPETFGAFTPKTEAL